jgi:hypothetical protein
MDTHKNARLTPKGREEMVRAVVDRGMSSAAAKVWQHQRSRFGPNGQPPESSQLARIIHFPVLPGNQYP